MQQLLRFDIIHPQIPLNYRKEILMNEQEKLEALAEIFDCDAGELKADTKLDAIGWDSMAMLSVIAMVKAQFDKRISGAEIRTFRMISDIMAVMER